MRSDKISIVERKNRIQNKISQFQKKFDLLKQGEDSQEEIRVDIEEVVLFLECEIEKLSKQGIKYDPIMIMHDKMDAFFLQLGKLLYQTPPVNLQLEILFYTKIGHATPMSLRIRNNKLYVFYIEPSQDIENIAEFFKKLREIRKSHYDIEVVSYFNPFLHEPYIHNDTSSCSVFAIKHSIMMAQSRDYELTKLIQNSMYSLAVIFKILSAFNIASSEYAKAISSDYSYLTPDVVKNAQSMGVINGYLLVHPKAKCNSGEALLAYVDRNSYVTYGKKRNYAISKIHEQFLKQALVLIESFNDDEDKIQVLLDKRTDMTKRDWYSPKCTLEDIKALQPSELISFCKHWVPSLISFISFGWSLYTKLYPVMLTIGCHTMIGSIMPYYLGLNERGIATGFALGTLLIAMSSGYTVPVVVCAANIIVWDKQIQEGIRQVYNIFVPNHQSMVERVHVI